MVLILLVPIHPSQDDKFTICNNQDFQQTLGQILLVPD